MRALLFAAALTTLAGAAHAQLQPAPKLPTPTVVPVAGLVPKVVNPQIQIVGDYDAYRLQVLKLKVTGLPGAVAVQLYEIRTGCPFEQQPGVSGLLNRTLDNTYSTDPDSHPRPLSPSGKGIDVGADGTVTINLQGVVPAQGGGILPEARALTDAELQATGFLATTIRTGAPVSSCTPSAIIVFRMDDGVWRVKGRDGVLHAVGDAGLQAATTVGRPWAPMERRHVVVEDTATLRTLLKPGMSPGSTGAVCSGLSEALGQPSYAVGVREIGGDIVFRARSGPAGTRCYIGMPSIALPEGVAVKARFSVTKVGDKCKVENGILPLEYLMWLFPTPPRFALSRVQAVLAPPVTVDSDGGAFDISATSWLDPWTFPDQGVNSRPTWQAHTAPVGAVLLCQPTAVNDHAVELRLDRIEFDVPNGVQTPR